MQKCVIVTNLTLGIDSFREAGGLSIPPDGLPRNPWSQISTHLDSQTHNFDGWIYNLENPTSSQTVFVDTGKQG